MSVQKIDPIEAKVLEGRARRKEHLEQMRQRQQQGLAAAKLGARLLKEKFGAKRVVLFGSLLDLKRMSWHSDIDLAVWGLPEKEFYRAGAALDRAILESGYDFSPVDLVEAQYAKPHILKAIEEEGLEL